MRRQRFEDLRERLLRAGIAPRHVRRYVRELEEHYEDALQHALSTGMSRSSAQTQALARLGNEDDLVRSVLAQPELRSIAARYPRLVFGAAPPCLWLAAVALSALAIGLFERAFAPHAHERAAWLLSAAYALCVFDVRVLPMLLGAALLALAGRQRLHARWPLLGVALVAVLSGTLSVNLMPAGPDTPGQLGLSSALLPVLLPRVTALGRPDLAALSAGLVRASMMVAMLATPYALWLRRLHARESVAQ